MNEYDSSVIESASPARRVVALPCADTGYRVQVSPTPTVIDNEGEPVSDAYVVSIQFQRKVTTTLAGHLPVVSGAGAAKILVRNTRIRGVPLC